MQGSVQEIASSLNVRRVNSEIDHTVVAEAVSKHEFAKVAIVGNENSTLAGGESKYVYVRKVCLVIGSDACRVVTVGFQVSRDPGIATRVDEELQR